MVRRGGWPAGRGGSRIPESARGSRSLGADAPSADGGFPERACLRTAILGREGIYGTLVSLCSAPCPDTCPSLCLCELLLKEEGRAATAARPSWTTGPRPALSLCQSVAGASALNCSRNDWTITLTIWPCRPVVFARRSSSIMSFSQSSFSRLML